MNIRLVLRIKSRDCLRSRFLAQVVLLALNLLIPVGLQVGSLDDNAACSALGGASVCGSAGLVGTNASLRAYIDANFHMIVQFLRDQLAARSRTTADKRVALNALGEVRPSRAMYCPLYLSWDLASPATLPLAFSLTLFVRAP